MLWGDGSADARVPVRRGLPRDGIVARRRALRRAGAGQPRRGLRDLDPRPGAKRSRAHDRITTGGSCGTRSKPNGQPRRSLDTSRAKRAVRLRGARRRSKRACAETIDVVSADTAGERDERRQQASRSSPASPARTAAIWPSCCSQRATRCTASCAARRASTRSASTTSTRIRTQPDARLFLHYGDLNDALVAQPHPAHGPARRDLQPRRAEPRARQLRRARVHRRGHRARHRAPARGDPRRASITPRFYQASSSELFGASPSAADREHAVLSAQPVRRAPRSYAFYIDA